MTFNLQHPLDAVDCQNKVRVIHVNVGNPALFQEESCMEHEGRPDFAGEPELFHLHFHI